MTKKLPNNMTLFHLTNKKVDFLDQRSVLSSLMCSKAEENEFKLQAVLRTFNIGVVANKNQSGVTYEEARRSTGLSKIEFDTCRKVARLFKNDELSFIKAFAEAGYPTWRSFAERSMYEATGTERPKPRRTNYKSGDIITYIRSKSPTDEGYQEHLEQVEMIKSSIDRYLPKEQFDVDINFLKYHECCCCGKYPPPEDGYRLVTKGGYPEYPVCDPCFTNKQEVNPTRVAHMYKVYSINLSEHLEKLISRL